MKENKFQMKPKWKKDQGKNHPLIYSFSPQAYVQLILRPLKFHPEILTRKKAILKYDFLFIALIFQVIISTF